MNAGSVRELVVEGFVKHEPKQARRGVVVVLSPWWRGPAHFVDAPLRVRLSTGAQLGVEQLAKGTSIRIMCTTLEAPRTGASWWAATSSAPPQLPPWLALSSATEQIPVIVLDRFFGRLVLEPRGGAFRGDRRVRRLAYQVRCVSTILRQPLSKFTEQRLAPAHPDRRSGPGPWAAG